MCVCVPTTRTESHFIIINYVQGTQSIESRAKSADGNSRAEWAGQWSKPCRVVADAPWHGSGAGGIPVHHVVRSVSPAWDSVRGCARCSPAAAGSAATKKTSKMNTHKSNYSYSILLRP